jgi:predicted  nucleic acid-binding Zn-ribbon protein
MSVTAGALRELHRIHTQLSDLRERLERGPKQIKAREANIARADAELAQAKADVKNARMSSDQKQLLLRTGESKIVDLKVKLNAAQSNREYQAFKDQIAAAEMAGSVLSDEILEAMEKIDELVVKSGEADQKLGKAKEELSKIQQSVRDQEALLADDVKRLEGELKEAESFLPADIRDAYNRIVKSKGADAMAKVDGETCGGCSQTITANMYSALILGRSVCCCQSCGRLLYLPEDRSPGRGS